jgi:NADPH2:quinone reductase
MLTQIAKERGAIVHGLVGGPRKLEYAAAFGADHVVDYRSGDWSAEVLRLTGGRGADLIVDGNGGPEAVKNYQAIAPLGRVVYIGATAGLPPPDVPVPLLIGRSFGVCGFSLPHFEKSAGATEIREITEAVRSGRWRVPIGEEVPLEDAPALHARFEARELMGRAVIRVGGEL